MTSLMLRCPLLNHVTSRHPRQVQEFHFLPLHSNWPLDSPESMFEGASEPGLPVFICVPGWHEPGHDPRCKVFDRTAVPCRER